MRSVTIRAAAIAVLSLVLASCAQPPPRPADNVQAPEVPALTLVGEMSGPWSHYKIHGQARDVDVFVAHDSQPKPVVVMFQGSACFPLFVIHGDGQVSDTSIFQDSIMPRLGRYHFVHIEKQGVSPLQFKPGMSDKQKGAAFEQAGRECSDAYMKHAAKNVRVEDGLAVIKALAAQSWAKQILLIGHSEGTHVVTGIMGHQPGPTVTAAGLMSSAGPTQFYGFYLSRAGDRQVFAATFERMRMLRNADDDLLYQELPARRWKSYALDSTPLEDVRDSTLPLYVAHGEREDNVLAADLFVLEALRQQPNRPLRYLVVRDGDHAFETSDRRRQFDAVVDDYLRWSEDVDRQTGVEELK